MTFRRKLIQSFTPILLKWIADNPPSGDEEDFVKPIAEELADAVIELRKPKVDLSQSDPAWSILFGKDIKEEQVERNRLEKAALEAFEVDMGCPKGWTWYAARTSEDLAWKALREFVIEQYGKDSKCFQAYQTWRTQPFARGAMSNLAIRKNPENFPASWSDFLASGSYVQKEQPQVNTDENDIPLTY